MGISSLPQGSKFKATTGAGNFKSKLSSLSKYGDLKSLGDNTDSIIKAVKKYERAIRLGQFSRHRQIAAMKLIKANDKNLTKVDKKSIKKIFKYLAEGEKKKVAINKAKVEDTGASNQEKIDKRMARFQKKRSIINSALGKSHATSALHRDNNQGHSVGINSGRQNNQTGLSAMNNRLNNSSLDNRTKSGLSNRSSNDRLGPPISFR